MDPLTIAAIAAPVIGGLFGKKGQSDANAANIQLAREQMQYQTAANAKAMGFSAEQADINRKFQERMSSTAYQRSMEDMKKAGLNPMLAAMKGGASTPGGASATGQTSAGATANIRSNMEHLANSAINMAGNIASVKKLQAEADLIENKASLIGPLSKITTELEGAVTGAIDYFGGDQKGGLGANTAKNLLKNFNSIKDSLTETGKELIKPGIETTDHVKKSLANKPKSDVKRGSLNTKYDYQDYNGYRYLYDKKGNFIKKYKK